MEFTSELYEDLLAVIRAANSEQINNLVNLIKGHVSKSELSSHLKTILGPGNQLKGTPTSSSTPDPRRRRRMIGRVQDMVNPLVTAPAKPWTSVTDDDDYVSHLLSLWFTWAHQWWCWVEKDLFLAAMRAGDLDSPVCSPYLVNMILADACVSTTLYVLDAQLLNHNSYSTKWPEMNLVQMTGCANNSTMRQEKE